MNKNKANLMNWIQKIQLMKKIHKMTQMIKLNSQMSKNLIHKKVIKMKLFQVFQKANKKI